MRWRGFLAGALLAVATGACGSDDGGDATPSAAPADVTTTTAAAPASTLGPNAPSTCPTNFDLGGEHEAPRECWPYMLRAAAESDGIVLDESIAFEQSASICRRFSTDPAAALTVLADWATGGAPTPVEQAEQGTFLVLAVAVYCPQFFDRLP